MQNQKYIIGLRNINDYVIIDLRPKEDYENAHFSRSLSFPLIKKIDSNYLSKRGFANSIGKEIVIESAKVAGAIKSIEPKKIMLLCKDGSIASQLIWERLRNEVDCYIYKGGYKALKKGLNQLFNLHYLMYSLRGNTGSGKTFVLEELKKRGLQTINLEKLANHNGSIFGNLENSEQPNQEQFEIDLAEELLKMDIDKPVFIEFEQSNIGRVSIPTEFRLQIVNAEALELKVSKSNRINNLIEGYAGVDDAKLAEGITFLQGKLPQKQAGILLKELKRKNYFEVADALISYFDATKGYAQNAHSALTIEFDGTDLNYAAEKMLAYIKEKAPENRGH